MLQVFRKNPMVAAGILLPLVIVVFFVLATMIPRWLVAPPAYDFVFTSVQSSAVGPALELSIVVEEQRLRARLYTTDRNYRNVQSLYLFEHESQTVREIPIKLPSDLKSVEDGAYVDIPGFAQRSVSTSRTAPDGYEIRDPGYRGGMLFPFYDRRRSRSLGLYKDGALVRVPHVDDSYYYNARFVGWLTD